jgi:hypothetical protein
MQRGIKPDIWRGRKKKEFVLSANRLTSADLPLEIVGMLLASVFYF